LFIYLFVFNVDPDGSNASKGSTSFKAFSRLAIKTTVANTATYTTVQEVWGVSIFLFLFKENNFIPSSH